MEEVFERCYGKMRECDMELRTCCLFESLQRSRWASKRGSPGIFEALKGNACLNNQIDGASFFERTHDLENLSMG